MRISDWSSDVCSSDLSLGCQTFHIACSAYADQRVRCAEATRAPHTCRDNDRSAIIGPTSRYEYTDTSGLPPPAMAASAPATCSSTMVTANVQYFWLAVSWNMIEASLAANP